MEQLKRLQSIEREMISEGKSSSEIDAFKATLRRQQNAGTTPQMGGLAVYMQEGGDPAEESFFERFNPLTGSYRRKKPLSVKAAETAIDFSPVGTVKTLDEMYDEYQQGNLAEMGIMAAAEVAGYLPFAGPAVKTMVRGPLFPKRTNPLPSGKNYFELVVLGNNKKLNDIAAEFGVNSENLADADFDTLRSILNRAEKRGVLDPRDAFSAKKNLDADEIAMNKEMFSEDVYHFSKGTFKGDTFDSSGGASRFDRLGTHVGTQKAAKDRSKVVLGDMDAEKIFSLPEGARGGSTMPLRARLDKPYLNSDGEAFSESGLKEAMNNYADQNKIADLDIAMEAFRKDLTDNGFTHIPYVNAIEDKGVVSNIMLTNRTSGDPAVLKGRFSKFEDAYDPRLMRAEGGEVMDGIGSLNETARGMSRGPRGIGAYQQFAGGGPVYMANGGSPQELMAQQAYQQMSDQMAQQAPMQTAQPLQTAQPMKRQARTVANLPINPGFTGFPLMPRPQTVPSNIRGDGMSANDLQRMLSRQTVAPENVGDVQSDIQKLQQADVAKRAAARRDESARRAREGNNPVPQPMPVPTGPFGGQTPQRIPMPFTQQPRPNPTTQQPGLGAGLGGIDPNFVMDPATQQSEMYQALLAAGGQGSSVNTTMGSDIIGNSGQQPMNIMGQPMNIMGQPMSQPMSQPMNIMGQPMQQTMGQPMQQTMSQPMQQPQFGGFGIGSLFKQQQQNTGGLGSPQPTSNVLF